MQVAVAGTPLEGMAPPSALDVVRCVAAARVLMPRSVVRLSAGRLKFTLTDQARPTTRALWRPLVQGCHLHARAMSGLGLAASWLV